MGLRLVGQFESANQVSLEVGGPYRQGAEGRSLVQSQFRSRDSVRRCGGRGLSRVREFLGSV